MNWRPALPALPLRHQGPWCRQPLDPWSKGVSLPLLVKRPVLGHSGLLQGSQAPPTLTPRAARLLCAPGRREDSGGWQHRGSAPTLVPGDRAPPPKGAARRTAEAGPGPQGSSTALPPRRRGMRPAGGRPRPGTWRGMSEGRAPETAQGSGDLRWTGVASEVSVRARRGLEGWGGQLHPQAPREGLKAADGGPHSDSRWGTPWPHPRLDCLRT